MKPEPSRVGTPLRWMVAGEIAPHSAANNHLSGWPGALTSKFFADGERHELSGWEDAVIPPDPSEKDPERTFHSFDRVPRRRAPMVTVLALMVLAIVGLAASKTNASSSAYHRLASSSLGQRATSAVQSLRRMPRALLAITP